MADTWRQRRLAKKTQKKMGGNLYKPSFAEQRRQDRALEFVDDDWAAFDAADAAETQSTDTGVSEKEAMSRKERRKAKKKGGLIEEQNVSAVDPADIASIANESFLPGAGEASVELGELEGGEISKLNPTAETSKFPLTKFINMGDKKTDPADFPSYDYHGGGSYSLKDATGTSTDESYDKAAHQKTIDDANAGATKVVKSDDQAAVDATISNLTSTGIPKSQDTRQNADNQKTVDAATSSTMWKGGGAPSALNISTDSDVSTDLTKNASTATTGDDSAGGDELSKKEQRKANRKSKKGKGGLTKTTDVASTTTANVPVGSGAGGGTSTHGTRQIAGKNWQLG